MSTDSQVAIGLDMGTGGARALAVSLKGEVLACGRASLPADAKHVDGPMIEQEPLAWTAAAQTALREMCSQLPTQIELVGVSVDATSGTFLLADSLGRPLTTGIMYNDLRAGDEASEADRAVASHLAKYGIRIGAAFALPKLLWLVRNKPGVAERTHRLLHQTDWLVGMLCGRYDVTDISTALKTGADPGTMAWPSELSDQLGIPAAWLPEIAIPGTTVGRVTSVAAKQTGLPAGTPVVAGCTDGTAGCLASGARSAGDLNVTLGTTLVFKAVADQPMIDPDGAIYNHRHPAGGFLPGAASSTGGEWIDQFLPGADLESLSAESADMTPTNHTAYPLVKQGERFPFLCSDAIGFGLEGIDSRAECFAAGMEGVAMLERMGIAKLEGLGLPIGPTIYATGGGAANDLWLQIRASACQRSFSVPQTAECAIGAAALAATPHMGDCAAAISEIVRTGRCIEPNPDWIDAYNGRYECFTTALRERGYA